MSFERDDRLGAVPSLSNTTEVYQGLIKRMVGEYMGANPKKGRTPTWILTHLRDGRDQITPRALVALWHYAAKQELDSPRASDGQLLHPTSLRRALDQVSDMHVEQLRTREMPWLAGVKQRLEGREVPMTREEWADLLARDWEQWRKDDRLRPPREKPEALLNYMIELGVCRERADGRIDVPDLFLHGLGVKRRGGVQR